MRLKRVGALATAAALAVLGLGMEPASAGYPHYPYGVSAPDITCDVAINTGQVVWQGYLWQCKCLIKHLGIAGRDVSKCSWIIVGAALSPNSGSSDTAVDGEDGPTTTYGAGYMQLWSSVLNPTTGSFTLQGDLRMFKSADDSPGYRPNLVIATYLYVWNGAAWAQCFVSAPLYGSISAMTITTTWPRPPCGNAYYLGLTVGGQADVGLPWTFGSTTSGVMAAPFGGVL